MSHPKPERESRVVRAMGWAFLLGGIGTAFGFIIWPGLEALFGFGGEKRTLSLVGALLLTPSALLFELFTYWDVRGFQIWLLATGGPIDGFGGLPIDGHPLGVALVAAIYAVASSSLWVLSRERDRVWRRHALGLSLFSIVVVIPAFLVSNPFLLLPGAMLGSLPSVELLEALSSTLWRSVLGGGVHRLGATAALVDLLSFIPFFTFLMISLTWKSGKVSLNLWEAIRRARSKLPKTLRRKPRAKSASESSLPTPSSQPAETVDAHTEN